MVLTNTTKFQTFFGIKYKENNVYCIKGMSHPSTQGRPIINKVLSKEKQYGVKIFRFSGQSLLWMPCSGLRHPYNLVKVHRRFGHQHFGFLHSFYWPGPGHFPALSPLSDEAPSLQFTCTTQPQPHPIRFDSEVVGNFFFPPKMSVQEYTA